MKFIRKYWEFLVVIVLALTPTIWLVGKGDVIINGVDTNFPLDPSVWLKRRFFVWDSSLNGGRDFSSSLGGIFFHLTQTVPFLLGFSLKNVQLLSMIFWFASVCLCALYFVKSFIKKEKLAQVVFVVLYSFNIYLFNTWENIKVSNLALYVGLPLLLSFLERYRNRALSAKRLVFYSAFAAILISGSGINPAYFIALVGGVFVYILVVLLFDKERGKTVTLGFLKMLTILLAVNAFWIFPLINFMFFSQDVSSLADLGLTNWLESLSKNTSLVNVFRLQGAWDWYVNDQAGFPIYIPYALNYFKRVPFLVFSFIAPMLALMSFVFSKKGKRNMHLLFSVFLVLGVFLGTGLHLPTGTVYRFLLNHVPLFSFFRSPWYIFTPYLTLAVSGLVALLIQNLFEFGNHKYFSRSSLLIRIYISIATTVFLIGHMFYSYPLITGKIFRPGRRDSFYVSFPQTIARVKEWLKKEGIDSRIISYPDDDLESFNWGYRGTESILGLFYNGEFITPSFNAQNSSYKKILEAFYGFIKKGSLDNATALLDMLGAEWFFNKTDASSLAPTISVNGFPRLEKAVSFEKWDFVKVADNRKIFSPGGFFLNNVTNEGMPVIMSSADTGYVLVNPLDSVVASESYILDRSIKLMEAKRTNREGEESSENQFYATGFVQEGDYFLVVEKKGVDTDLMQLFVDGEKVQMKINKDMSETFVVGPYHLGNGDHEVIVLFPEAEDILGISDFAEYQDVGMLREEDLPSDLSKTLVMVTGSAEIKLIFPIARFDPFVNYILEFDHKFFHGHSPIVDVLQSNTQTPLKVFTIDSGASFDWEKRRLYVNPADIVDSKMELILRIPEGDMGDNSKSYFENFQLKRVYDNRLFLVEKREVNTRVPKIEYTKKSPVKYEVKVENLSGDDYVLVFLENYSPDWVLRGSEDFDYKHFTVNDYANAWYISATNDDKVFEIYYKPQTIFYIGVVTSALALGYSVLGMIRKGNVKDY